MFRQKVKISLLFTDELFTTKVLNNIECTYDMILKITTETFYI